MLFIIRLEHLQDPKEGEPANSIDKLDNKIMKTEQPA
jgi:hypothetical protein